MSKDHKPVTPMLFLATRQSYEDQKHKGTDLIPILMNDEEDASLEEGEAIRWILRAPTPVYKQGFWRETDLPEVLDQFAERLFTKGRLTEAGWELKAYDLKMGNCDAAKVVRNYPTHRRWLRTWIVKLKRGVYLLKKPSVSIAEKPSKKTVETQ